MWDLWGGYRQFHNYRSSQWRDEHTSERCEMQKFHSENLEDLERILIWLSWLMQHVWEIRQTYRTYFWKNSKENISREKWVKEMCEEMDWIQLAQDRIHWWSLVCMVMNLHILYDWELLTSHVTISFYLQLLTQSQTWNINLCYLKEKLSLFITEILVENVS